MDLRSSVTKEAISLLVALANTYPTEFAHNSQRYMNADIGGANSGGSFFKQLNNGKKLLSDMANEGII